jgi:hypothetical protein
MFKRLNALVIIALCTSCAMIAFAYYERYEVSSTPPASAFYFAAAIICLLPSLYGLFRHGACRYKRQLT